MTDKRYPMPKNLDDEYLELFNQLTEEHKQRVLTAAFDIMDWRSKHECGESCDEESFGTHGKFDEENEQCQSCLRNAIGNATFKLLQLHPEWEEMPEFWWKSDYTIEGNVQEIRWMVQNRTDMTSENIDIKLTDEEYANGEKILKEYDKHIAWMQKWLEEKNDCAKSMNKYRRDGGFYHFVKSKRLPKGSIRLRSRKCHTRRWVTFDGLLRQLNEKIEREQISL